MPIKSPTNDDIAHLLEQIADQLEQQDDNPYRIQAFRNGARSVRASQTPLTEIVQKEGGEALTQIEGIGQGLATTIFEFIQTGRSSYLQQLRARQSPEELFRRVPGLGEKLARRVVHQLEISSLEALEQAAHDGRLEQVKGFGPRRVAAIRHSLAGMLGRSAQQRKQPNGVASTDKTRPDVALLLEVDAEYRRRAKAGELPKLAPRRFNPTHEAWLPVMRAEHAGWTMTVLFSNTARAHELGKTHDWVVIYYQQDGPEEQCTVVTETWGALEGKRVIRGRENECLQFYRVHQGETEPSGKKK
jgi:Holliday junction resolvasome RuvABC DNA-binding subunit